MRAIPAISIPGASARRSSHPRAPATPLLPIATLILWLVCTAIGLAGWVWPRFPVRPSYKESKPVETQLLKVELEKSDAPPYENRIPPDQPAPLVDAPPAAPGAPPPMAIPDSPAPVAVAAPGPAIAFQIPVEGYTRLVDLSEATHSRPVRIAATTAAAGNSNIAPPAPPHVAPAAAAAASPLVVRRLTLGEGEGRQPAPEYPREAIMNRQQGTVTVRFSVDETGRVTNVETASACRWPLLNQAALRTVRERWHFSPGPPRSYEVPIEFQFEK